MKYYKLKSSDVIIYNFKKLYANIKDARKENNGGFFSHIGAFDQCKCRSIDDLRQKIFEFEFKYNVGKSSYSRSWKLIDEIIEKIGVETFEIDYPNKPCIVVECKELSDQYECDADRTPIEYLNSAKELENKKYSFEYEVYIINENGSLELNDELGTYFN